MNWFFRVFRKTNVSRLERAQNRIDQGAEQFRQAAEALPAAQARVFWDLAAASTNLRNEVARAPDMITPLRKIIFFYLPKMAELSLRWARLSAQDPFTEVGAADQQEFHSYLSILENALSVCKMRRHDELERVMAAFQTQLRRLDG